MHIESRFDARPIKHTGEHKNPVCGDSRHDLNYPEIPNSLNNKEKTKMANFNDKINSHKEFVLRDMEHDYFIRRIGSMTMLKREFDYNVNYLKSGYRLFIQYKDTCREQKLAGRCFMWACTSNTSGISDVQRLCVDEDIDNVGNPIFNYIDGAVLISEKGVLTYGDVQIEADCISQDKKHVVCDVSLCGSIVSGFRIPAEVFDRLFGLKENFPEQCAKPVQEENDLVEKVKRNVELCENLLYSIKQMIDRAVDLMQGSIIEIEDSLEQAALLIQCALIYIEDRKRELDDTIDKLRLIN